MAVIYISKKMGIEIKKLKFFKCDRCSHTWQNRKPEMPKRCPLCNSKFWNYKASKNKKLEKRLWKKIKQR